jgi:hypothetical protein
MYVKQHLKIPQVKKPEVIGPNPKGEARIAEAAYLIAERRGFIPGHELEDWLMAEREIILRESSSCYSQQNRKAASKTA